VFFDFSQIRSSKINVSLVYPIILSLLIISYSNSIAQIWEQTSGPPNGVVWAIGIDDEDVIYAADDAVLYRSTDDGDSWDFVHDWSSVGFEIVSIVFNDSGDVFVGVWGGPGVFRSTDDGVTWLEPNQTIPNVNSVAISFNDDVIAGTMNGVYISTNYGYDWELRDNGFPEPTIIMSIFVDDINNYFAGTYSGQDAIYKSTDLGMSWYASGPPIYWFAIVSIINNSSNTLFASSLDARGVNRSTDNGSTWEYFTSGIPIPSQDIILISNESDQIFAGSSNYGVYISVDNGESWTEYLSGLSNDNIFSFGINSKGILFAGTWGDGVYRTIQSTLSVKTVSTKIPSDFYLLQNFPNPFNPSTRFKFGISKEGKVELTIYDSIGRKVNTLIDESLSAGHYELDFEARGLTSGIYFYTISAGEFTDTKKLILLK
jgi:photosystem II stability/assembly factor-like uncharacterized protein